MYKMFLRVGVAVDDRRVEICVWEKQSLSCTDADRIIITSAKYSQLVEGRCNNSKSENASCFDESDVGSFVKARCEQRIACELKLPDKELDNTTVSSCLKAVMKTLEIVYQCTSSKFCFCTSRPYSVIVHVQFCRCNSN